MYAMYLLVSTSSFHKQRSVPVKQLLAGWIPLLGTLQPRHIVLQIIADQLLQSAAVTPFILQREEACSAAW